MKLPAFWHFSHRKNYKNHLMNPISITKTVTVTNTMCKIFRNIKQIETSSSKIVRWQEIYLSNGVNLERWQDSSFYESNSFWIVIALIITCNFGCKQASHYKRQRQWQILLVTCIQEEIKTIVWERIGNPKFLWSENMAGKSSKTTILAWINANKFDRYETFHSL
jgi:hypothetical protein